MTQLFQRGALGAALVIAAILASTLTTSALAADSTKDIVLDRVTLPALAPATAAALPTGPAASTDAMAVSVLLESPDGSLAPKSVNTLFKTGDRFRVKLLASRNAKVSIYNTNPLGQFNPKPVWQGTVTVGQETISQRLRLDGNSGVDYMHVVLEPAAPPQGFVAWLASWIGKEGAAAPKDIRLDSENTPTASYLLNQSSQGLAVTVRIVHR